MTRRSQKQKTGNSSESGSGKPHLACPPATEHRGGVRQIFESLNIQFERLRSDPVMRGQRDPTALHNFAALLNRAVTPVTTEEKIVFETIRYLSDANRAKLCRWMFSAHLACISLCADERLVALGLNIPSDVLVAMRPDGTLVIRHAGISGTAEFSGKNPPSGAPAKPQEPALVSDSPAPATPHSRGGSKVPAATVQATPVKAGKADTGATNGRGAPAEHAIESPPSIGGGRLPETDPIQDDGALSGAATGRRRDARRPVVADARYQQVLESLKAASTAATPPDAVETKKQGGAPNEPLAGLGAKNTQPATAPRHGPQSSARPGAASEAPATNGQPKETLSLSGSPLSYRDAAATPPDCDRKKKSGTPVGILRTARSTEAPPSSPAPAPTNKPTPNKTKAGPTEATPQDSSKRVLSRIEEETELLLDFIRATPETRTHPVRPNAGREISGVEESNGVNPRGPTEDEGADEALLAPACPAEPAQGKIVSWADAPSDEEDKEADLAVQVQKTLERRHQQPPPPEQKRGSSETKRAVTFASDRRARDARTSKDAGDKKSNRRGGRRRRQRDQSSASTNKA